MKIKKLVQQKFIKDATNLLIKYGAINTIDNCFELKTVFGQLYIKVDEDSSVLHSIFMRFEYLDLKLFSVFFSLAEINPYSFKWNVLDNDLEYILNELEERLDNLVYANKVIRISDATNKPIEQLVIWAEEDLNETFNELYNN